MTTAVISICHNALHDSLRHIHLGSNQLHSLQPLDRIAPQLRSVNRTFPPGGRDRGETKISENSPICQFRTMFPLPRRTMQGYSCKPMLKLNRRIAAIKPSATLAADARATEMKLAGIDVVSLAAGEPDFDTPERIKQAAIKALAAGQTKYTAVGGTAA